MNGKKVIVTQVRGVSGRTKEVKDTLKALGLGRIGKKKEHTINDPLYGMLRKVRHLIRVVEA